MDDRIIGLDSLTTSQLASLLTTLEIPFDAPSLSDAHKVALNDLLSSEFVANNSSINSRALTPAGFAASLANSTRRGIVYAASDAQVTAKNASAVIYANQQNTMQTQWDLDWHSSKGASRAQGVRCIRDNDNWDNVVSCSFDVLWPGGGALGSTARFSPTELATKWIKAAIFDLIYVYNGTTYSVRNDLTSVDGSSSGFTVNGNFWCSIENYGDKGLRFSTSSAISGIAGRAHIIIGGTSNY